MNKQKKPNFISHFFKDFRWLSPGLGIKRWTLVYLFGTMLIGLGFAVIVLDVYRTSPDTWWLPILSFLSLRFLSRPVRALVFGGLGVALVILGVVKYNRILLKPFMRPGKPIYDTVSEYQKKERGPRVVVLGGGTGLSAMLRGLKKYTRNITAIVTVADDGGSSGELRRTMGVLPPGDIRNCLAALSNDEELVSQMFQYRFASGAGLNGHTLGNLLITALTDITGSFEEAIAESGRVLAVHGKVLPSTLHDVKLVADVNLTENGQEVRIKGESEIPKAAGQIQRIWLEPNNPLAYPPTIQAILSADLVIIGPGSLFTSIIPNLLVPDIAAALKSSRAVKFFVCNVATQPGETDGFNCGDHVRAIEKYLDGFLFDLLICNDQCEGQLPEGLDWVCVEEELKNSYAIYQTDLVDPEKPWRHESEKLASAIMDLFYEKTGPLMPRDGEFNL